MWIEITPPVNALIYTHYTYIYTLPALAIKINRVMVIFMLGTCGGRLAKGNNKE